jgi:ABC-2 type transport system ATP-binding protein
MDVPVSALSLTNVSKSFGSFKAVHDINLDVKHGEVFGFLGPNGAGKSTTIRLILDILRPDSGTISILGSSSRDIANVHRQIGFLSGDMVIDGDLTGKQYLSFINHLHGGHHTHTLHKLAETLEARLDVKIGNYSRGNRQKIGLIAAMLPMPKLLILDEPTSGFDPLVQEKFSRLIRGYIAAGGTVFMSSHVLAEVQHLCDRVAFIKEGKIITTKAVAKLLDTNAKRIQVTASGAEIRRILKNYNSVAGLTLMGQHENELSFSYAGDIQPLLRYFTGKPIADITIREPELEEIFGHYYGVIGSDKEPKSA